MLPSLTRPGTFRCHRYDEWYEPFVVVDRLDSSWADQRFRGYLRGRAALTLALQVQGYRFMVHPRAFLIHRPHSVGTAHQRYAQELEHEAQRQAKAARRKKNWDRRINQPHTLKDQWIRTQSMLSHDAMLQSLCIGAAEQGLYRPSVDFCVLSCIKSLPWWGKEAAKVARAKMYILGKRFVATDWDIAERVEQLEEGGDWAGQQEGSESGQEEYR